MDSQKKISKEFLQYFTNILGDKKQKVFFYFHKALCLENKYSSADHVCDNFK